MTQEIVILQAGVFPEQTQQLVGKYFKVVHLPTDETAINGLLNEYAQQIRGIIVRNHPLSKILLSALPNLEIISSYNAGLDGVDLDYCRTRHIIIHNTSTVLARDVADLGVALAVMLTRYLLQAHHFICAGGWEKEQFKFGHSIADMNTLIVGLGHIGTEIAARMTLMGSAVAYYGPNKKEVTYPYFDNIIRAAEWADVLFICCPATAETNGLVNQQVLDALGPDGYLINIARGSIIDESALIQTLKNRGIRGAGLDVFANEPLVPQALCQLDNVLLSPHIASATHETRRKMGEAAVDKLRQHFATC